MPTMETTLATGTRCEHDGERDACPWCNSGDGFATGSGTRNVRTSETLARAMLAALQRRTNLVREIRGYRFLSGTVSANGATSPVVRAISNGAEYIGAQFYSDVSGETLQRVARYIGHGGHGDALQRVLLSDGSPVSYVARLSVRMARDIATGSGTGRGTMPYFRRDVADVLRALRDRYRDALPDVPAFTMGNAWCPVHAVNGCPLPVWGTSPDGGRDRIGDGCTMGTVAALPVLPRRRMSHGERALIVRTFRPERGERSPLYAQWRDGHGDTLPDVVDGHNAGTLAHNVPERDASPLQRGTLWERVRASGATVADVAALRVAWDIVNVPDKRGRFAKRVQWATVASELGHTGKRDGDRVARNVRRVARVYREREMWDTIRDTPATVPVVPRTGLFTVAVRTGTVPVNRRTGTPTTRAQRERASVHGHAFARMKWATVAPHDPKCTRGGQCASECDAMEMVRDRGDVSPMWERPLWTVAPCECDAHTNAMHDPKCPIGRARSRRVAMWDRVNVDTSPDTVRALVARHARARAHGAT